MKRLLLSFLWLLPAGLFAQITIDESLTTQELIQDVLIGGTCAETSNFISSTGIDFGDSTNGIAAFNSNGSDFPFESGVILSSGSAASAPGPNLDIQNNGGFNWPGDADLEANTGATSTGNASFIQFDFTPLTDQLSFNFIMASEEYDQFFECTFSDAFAFILTDIAAGTSENLAVLPGTSIPIQVTNIRPEVPDLCPAINEEFFDRYNFLPFNNENEAATNFNGQTVTLTASSPVTPGTVYNIKLVVADETDTLYDIAVFLEAGSFNVGATDLGEDILIANGNAVCEGNSVTLDATDPDAQSYTWFFEGTELMDETLPTLTVNTGGTYSVSVALIEPEDCVINDSIVVEFIGQDSVNIGDDLEACEDTPGTLDTGLPEDSVSFVWTLDGMVITDETGPSITATSSGTYEVTATFDAGCSFSDAALSVVNTTPLIDLGDDVNSCLEDPITLDGTPSNVDPTAVTYQWALNGTFIEDETNMTLDISDPGTYEVFVTLDGCTGSDAVIVSQFNEDGSSCTINDTCPEALAVVCGEIITGNTDGSTSDGAPSETCGTTPGAPGNWYAFNGTGDLVNFSLANSDFDTKIQIYSGECDDLTCIGGNDDSNGTVQSEFEFETEVDTEYLIYVFGFGISTGNYELTVTCIEVTQGCEEALPIACGEVISGNTSDSTSNDAPTDPCGTTAGAPGDWYSFTGTGDQIELSLCNSDYDTKIQVYSGSCDDLVCVGGNDDSCGLQSEFGFESVPGEEYLIYVFGFGTNTGNYELALSCVNIPQGCIDAEVIACGDIISGNTAGAPEEDIPSDLCDLEDGAPGVWFTLAGTDELVNLSLCNSTFDTRINVYTGFCNDLECLASNDDFCDTQSEVEFVSQSGLDYLIYVSGADGESGDFELVVTCSPPPGCIDADPFCSDDGLIFENISDGTDAQPGIDYGCLLTQPNPSWFFLEIEESGDLDFEIVQNTEFDENGNPIGQGLDVDFIAWGPFENELDACTMLTPTNQVDCSYSIDAIETFSLTNTQEGEIYIVLITNFNGSSGFISLGQTGGTGATNCDILIEFELELGDDQIVCSDTANSFEIIPTITGEVIDDPTYLWSTGETTETISVTETGTYSVEVSADGFTVIDEVTITFIEPLVDLGEDQVICDDGSFTIIPIVDADINVDGDDDDFQYLWSTGETTETITVSDSGSYTLTITNDDGCTATDTIEISVESAIAIDAGEDFLTCRNFENTLNATVESTGATYQWFLNGDLITGATATTLDFMVGEMAVGTQEYMIVVTSALGCTSSDTVEVSLYDVGQCVISEGLSPTGSPGFNDTLDLTFLADRTGITNLQIFNRLGAVVFEQSDYVNEWRGQTDAGDNLPTGTYFYVINFDAEDPDFGTQATGWIYVNQEE